MPQRLLDRTLGDAENYNIIPKIFNTLHSKIGRDGEAIWESTSEQRAQLRQTRRLPLFNGCLLSGSHELFVLGSIIIPAEPPRLHSSKQAMQQQKYKFRSLRSVPVPARLRQVLVLIRDPKPQKNGV